MRRKTSAYTPIPPQGKTPNFILTLFDCLSHAKHIRVCSSAFRRLPISAEGQYLLLLRIEAVNDKESDSDLRVLGVGNGVVHSGAVAGFPMPTIKFFVGSKAVKSVQPDFLFTDSSNKDIQTWRSLKEATFYRLEFVDEAGNIVFSAITVQPNYRLPSWFKEKFAGKSLQKRLYALDENGKIIGTEINRQPIMKFSAPDKTQ